MKDAIQRIIDKYIDRGIPGIQVALKTSNDFCVLDGGFADPVNKIRFVPETVSWLFSITKTYTVVLLMKEKERGKIDLDSSICNYLPAKVSRQIKGASDISVKMLMNHTSGLVDFITLPEFLNIQFTRPLQQPDPTQLLNMSVDRDLLFSPGSDFSYSNTNYFFLQVLLEELTGRSYADLLYNQILEPLELEHTFLNLSSEAISGLPFPLYFYDPTATGRLENASAWNTALGKASNGWGGIAATASDVILFYESLVSGRVVKADSFKEMTAWIQGQKSLQPNYGLGLEYFQYTSKQAPQFGHEGDGIGNNTMMFYAPCKNRYMYVNITVGRKFGGPFLESSVDLKNELARLVANWPE